MFITPFIIIAVIVVLTSLNFKNKYLSILVFYMVSISYLIFIAAVYVSKISSYNFPLKMDYLIYSKLTQTPIIPLQLSRGYNLGIVFFMLASVYCARKLLDLDIKKTILLIIPTILFFIYTDPIVARNIWIHQYYEPEKNISLFLSAINLLESVSKALMLLYSVLPFICAYRFYRETKYLIKRFHIKIFAICIALIIIFFYTIFITGPFEHIMYYNVNPMGLPDNEHIVTGYILVPFVSFILFSVIVVLLMVFKPFNMFYFEYNKNRDIVKNTQTLTRNIGIDLHIYKNMFWSARQQFELIKFATNAGDYSSVNGYADTGIEMINNQLDKLQNTINAMNEDFSKLDDIDIIKCIDIAISRVKSPIKVRIVKDYDIKSIATVGNEHILTEVFLNLITNSHESFENTDIKNPTLIIRIQVEDNMCMIEISDNGCGIPKTELKNIFNPFYSTKVRTKNSGIGLNYVKEVIKSYHGTIEVISKVNQYTTFQISLPISKRKEHTDE